MKIFIGADHRGFEMKNQLVEWLKSEGHEVEDCGDYEYKPLDNYPEIAKKVISAVIANRQQAVKQSQEIATPSARDDISQSFGILLCGSGIGVSIVANRYKGIRCALGFHPDQVAHGRTNDHINVLSIPSDFVDVEKAKELVNVFLKTKSKMEEKYLERIGELDA